MRAPRTLALCLLALAAAGAHAAEPRPVHLFILSGQSNMANLDPEASFRPALKAALPDADIRIVHHAKNGQPIAKWHQPADPDRGTPAQRGRTYKQLMDKVRATLPASPPASITFIWMQGEADARGGTADSYAESFETVIGYLREDLKRQDIRVVIGRINDYKAPDTKPTPDWDQMRATLVTLADRPDRRWINTDDLNGEHDGLHFPKDGYTVMGERFAAAALEMITAK